MIADRGFPFWPGVETIDLSLVDDVPRVIDVLQAIRLHWTFGKVWMAEEFRRENNAETVARFTALLGLGPVAWEPHVAFKMRIPEAIGLIRTGDTTQYANVILESA